MSAICCPSMTSLANIDPSLHDMSFSDVNPTLADSNLAASQDRLGHDADGNSIPGGEPVHH